MKIDDILSTQQLRVFCRKHHIRQLSFFGSVLREDFGPQSDVDVLVEFEPGHTPGLDFFLIEAELSQLLKRRVDLQTINFLSPDIRNSVLSEAFPAYEQA
jgi:predicted nucleotidyltransferase